MSSAPASRSSILLLAILALVLVAGTLWLRAPGFGFQTWNVDEAIHAAVAHTLLDGGVLYRDAVDQRTPLTYCVMAAIFAVAGENNLYAAHVGLALLVAFTAGLLFLVARRMAGVSAGLWSAVLYVVLATGLFYQGDANAFVTEWFVAFFTTAAAWVFWSSPEAPSMRRLVLVGAVFSLAFLSKQPGALDLAAPALTLAYVVSQGTAPEWRRWWFQWSGLLLGFIAVLAPVLVYYALRGAFADFIFYTWTYNLRYYGPEVGWMDRLASAGVPFRLLAAFSPVLLAVVVAAALSCFRVLLQRQPTSDEIKTNPARFYVVVWTLSALAGAASGGRGYDHYSIQILPPLCLGTAWFLGHLTNGVRSGAFRPLGRIIALLLLILTAAVLFMGVRATRHRTLPVDPSQHVARYIAAHSTPADTLFVWGYHPDIYLFANRKPASRFVYASFVTGLIPWTNCADDRATDYAIVPGTLETLLRDLETSRPVFIVDCSAGPNRHWNKYPLEKFPPLAAFVRERYLPIESGQFQPQGFRLFVLKNASHASLPVNINDSRLSASDLAAFVLPEYLGQLTPLEGSAPYGASATMEDGRMIYFAHAPSRLRYALPSGADAIRGGMGFRPGAYAPDNRGPTDGAEFRIDLLTADGNRVTLLRRLLQPGQNPADRSSAAFRVVIPPGGQQQIEFIIDPGPAGNAASDWTFWSDLTLENCR